MHIIIRHDIYSGPSYLTQSGVRRRLEVSSAVHGPDPPALRILREPEQLLPNGGGVGTVRSRAAAHGGARSRSNALGLLNTEPEPGPRLWVCSKQNQVQGAGQYRARSRSKALVNTEPEPGKALGWSTQSQNQVRLWVWSTQLGSVSEPVCQVTFKG